MNKRGAEGERKAAEYLEKQGLKILCRNFRSPFGEIDLIASDGETLCFIEVRQRCVGDFGRPQETVRRQKQDRIIRTAETYLQKAAYPRLPACRFDVVAILGDDQPEWFQNAFM